MRFHVILHVIYISSKSHLTILYRICSFNGHIIFNGTIHIPTQVLRQEMKCLSYKYSVTTQYVPLTEEELIFGANYSRLLKIPDTFLISGSMD